ncbi:O-antigen ligase family protein [Sphingomonas qomolangmaensis]|uniref:O-antigen ligase family protein n=1 Tax=Sphingomonas qomolangmaensis TaxID=2918765 RepID=A0ABY5L5E3_9SPHN|nr:O-antigen ligase family protein [Sphingomonas qomolangmaensis]UUL82179.1 O-antigen ligase family protein [Sphingomonas qomolangmaensis]
MRLLFIAVIVGLVSNGLSIEIGGFPVTIERAIGLTLIALMSISIASDHSKYAGKDLILLLLAWNAILFVSAVLTASPGAHMAALAISLVPTAAFWLIVRYQLPHATIARVVQNVLWFSGIAGLIGLIVGRVAGYEISLWYDDMGRMRLFISEPNLLGSAMGFLILVSMARAKFTLSWIIPIALSVFVLLAANSRVPVLAFGICAVLFSILRSIATRRGVNQSLLLPLWAGVALLTVILVFSTQVQDFYDTSLRREDTYSVRAFLIDVALERFREKPVLGAGPGDFGLQNFNIMKQFGATDRNTLWVPNMFISVLHDSGIAGIIVYTVFLVALTVTGLRRIFRGSVAHCAYVSAFLFIVICSQATTVHLSIIFGVAAGLVGLRFEPQRRLIDARPRADASTRSVPRPVA